MLTPSAEQDRMPDLTKSLPGQAAGRIDNPDAIG